MTATQGVAPGAASRLAASVAAAVLAVDRGATIVRVHDVLETVQALAVWAAMREQATPDSHVLIAKKDQETLG